MSKRLTLVLGGVRAGKSSYAQRLAARGKRVLFLATAEAGDREMAARIQAHREIRPAEWDTIEAPIDPVTALAPLLHGYDMVVLDCLTLWVSNLLLSSWALRPRGWTSRRRHNGCCSFIGRARPPGSSSAMRWDSE